MSRWGMGITQSDEYCDIYERFMKEYDEGKPVSDITSDILEENEEVFVTEDGALDSVLHDVYFALARAEWMCGGISEKVLLKVTEIIHSDANVDAIRALEVPEQDLKLRKKNLYRFLNGLSTPREKVKKRKTPVEKYVPKEKPIPLPPVQCGDVFAYKNEGQYRILAIVERERYYELGMTVYCYVWEPKFVEIPTFEMLSQSNIMPIGRFIGEQFPSSETLSRLGNWSLVRELNLILPERFHFYWRRVAKAMAKTEDLWDEYPPEYYLSFQEVIQRIKYMRGIID